MLQRSDLECIEETCLGALRIASLGGPEARGL
jgi:hypothetical protein